VAMNISKLESEVSVNNPAVAKIKWVLAATFYHCD
jgi:hypothetical protein